MLRALVLVLLATSMAGSSAEAQSRTRPRIIWDVPPDKVVRIGRVSSGRTIEVDVPFHSNGDLVQAQVVLWSRGVVAGLVTPSRLGPVSAFTPHVLLVRVSAPPRVPPGPYSINVKVEDRETGAHDIFRTTVMVEEASEAATAPPTPLATATPRPSPPPVPTATPTPRRPVLGWGRFLPATRVIAPRKPAPDTGERSSARGGGFVRP